jgi:hypothetical protein
MLHAALALISLLVVVPLVHFVLERVRTRPGQAELPPSAPAPSDPRWAALAEGRLSSADRAALETEAMQTKQGRAL